MFPAIDVHGHFGDSQCFPQKQMEKEFMRLSIKNMENIYRRQNIVAAFLSPMEALFPENADSVLNANQKMEEVSMEIPWIYQWVVVDPLYPETFLQAEKILKSPKCVGVKIHPDANGYQISDYGDELFAFCNENHAILETHSGDKNSMPEVLIPFADQYPQVQVIASHLGCGWDGELDHQVRAVKEAKYHNIYTDVSSGRSLVNNLIEWASEELPADHLMFGTDFPIHHVPMMRARIDFAEISEERKRQILLQSACRLFGEKIGGVISCE